VRILFLLYSLLCSIYQAHLLSTSVTCSRGSRGAGEHAHHCQCLLLHLPKQECFQWHPCNVALVNRLPVAQTVRGSQTIGRGHNLVSPRLTRALSRPRVKLSHQTSPEPEIGSFEPTSSPLLAPSRIATTGTVLPPTGFATLLRKSIVSVRGPLPTHISHRLVDTMALFASVSSAFHAHTHSLIRHPFPALTYVLCARCCVAAFKQSRLDAHTRPYAQPIFFFSLTIRHLLYLKKNTCGAFRHSILL
jgi:hypothetical protein